MTSVPVKHRTKLATTPRTPGQSRRLREFAAMERRRMQAADLFERDLIPAEIARQVGVSHQIVSDWRKAWRQGGREALRSAGRAGRKPKLSDEQRAAVEAALLNGAEANGYANELWTLPRVAEVIARVTGVSYHPGHVWYVLRDQLDWTWQRPARRAVERNDAAVEQWVKKRWPQLKKAHGARTR
jgi:transposase